MQCMRETYENVFSFKSPNRSFSYVTISDTDLESYAEDTLRMRSHTRRPFIPITADDINTAGMESVDVNAVNSLSAQVNAANALSDKIWRMN